MFLLVALVPFTVGCGLFGSDYDDPDPIATTTLTKVVKVPASVVAAANARAAKISYTKLKLIIDGIEFTVPATSTPTYDEATGLWNVTFSAKVVSSIAEALKGKANVTVKLVNTTSGSDVTLAEAVVTYGNSLTGVILTVDVDNTGKVKFTFPAGFSVTSQDGVTAPVITYFNATAAIGDNALTIAETIPAANDAAWNAVYATTDLTPTVRVTFKKGNPAANVNYALPTGVTLANTRWVIFVKNVTTGATFTLNSTVAADKALFTVAAVTGNDAAVDVTFASTTTKSLDANSKYQVTILDTNLTTADGDVLDVDNFLFKTAANAQ